MESFLPRWQPMRVARNQSNVKFILSGLILILMAASGLAQTVPANRQSPGVLPQAPSATSRPYSPITGKQRLQWFVKSTIGPETLAVGMLSAAIGTARDVPKEYGPHWEGFGKRYGMRLTGISTGNLMEAGLGAVWGEDPRYFPSYGMSFKGRVKNLIVMTLLAHNRAGKITPAYARYIAKPGNNFLSNTWRADSEATTRAAAVRTLLGFAGLMGKNAINEFWPDARKRIFRHNH